MASAASDDHSFDVVLLACAQRVTIGDGRVRRVFRCWMYTTRSPMMLPPLRTWTREFRRIEIWSSFLEHVRA